MWFWIFIMISVLLIPITMIGFGKLFMKRGPKTINYAFGYRTTMSMKNMDTWSFAHKYIGKIWFACGLILIPVSVIPMLFTIGKDADTIGNAGMVIAILQLIPLLGSIIPTEIALKRTFDKYGARK